MDDTWTAFVKHDQFWNLAHAPQKIPDPTPIEPIRLQTGLAGGIADPIFSSLLAKRLGKEEEEAEQAAGLEPPFPYGMTKFDAAYFEL